MTYFQPMTAGYAKVFGRPFDEFWCDHGTATESFTKLGDSIYFSEGILGLRQSVPLVGADLGGAQPDPHPDGERAGRCDTSTYEVESIDGGALVDGHDSAAARAGLGGGNADAHRQRRGAGCRGHRRRRLPRGARRRRRPDRLHAARRGHRRRRHREPQLGGLQVRSGAAGDRDEPHERRRQLRRRGAGAHERRRQVGQQQHRRRRRRDVQGGHRREPRAHRGRRERQRHRDDAVHAPGHRLRVIRPDLRAVLQPLRRAVRDVHEPRRAGLGAGAGAHPQGEGAAAHLGDDDRLADLLRQQQQRGRQELQVQQVRRRACGSDRATATARSPRTRTSSTT